ncbi:hypothetical protein FACS1894186_3270 [Alphaproteobacteria bacterium]|nr:hypothetical protein FACS1894186_3270 [Alphaproteobacteria bacterium]
MTESCGFPAFAYLHLRAARQTLPRHMARMAVFLERAWEAPPPRRALLTAFRNSGKSTLAAVFCAWALSRNPNLRILVLAAEHDLACRFVRNARRVVESHPLTRGLLPTPRDQWAGDRFTVSRAAALRDPSLAAKGLGANITGGRADLVICDDVEVPRTASTAALRSELRARLGELEFVANPDAMTLYLGTPHASDTIYDNSATGFLAGYRRLKIPLLDAGGASAWPERFDPEAVARLLHRAGPSKFASQMLLEPAAAEAARFDVSAAPIYAEPLEIREAGGVREYRIGGIRMASVAAFWDPAFAAGQGGDRSVLAVVFRDAGGTAYLHRTAYLAARPEDPAASQCEAVASVAAELALPAVHVEINGLGRFLPAILRKTLRAAAVPCRVAEHSSVGAKASRIAQEFDARVAARALRLSEAVALSPFMEEFAEWSPLARGHDDGLDAAASALAVAPSPLAASGMAGCRARTEFALWGDS